jgi:hypothetical protein
MLLLQSNMPSYEPTPGKPSPGVSKTPGQDHRAWQQAMEQAQIADWFNVRLDERGGRATVNTRPTAPVSAAAPETREMERQKAFPREPGTAGHHAERSCSEAPANAPAQSAGSIAPVQCVHSEVRSRHGAVERTPDPSQEAGPVGGHGAPTKLTMISDIHTEVRNYLSQAGLALPQSGMQPPVEANTLPSTFRPDGFVVKAAMDSALLWFPGAPSAALQACPPTFGNAESMKAQREELADFEAPSVRASRYADIQSVAGENPVLPVRIHVDWSEQGVRVWLGVSHAATMSAPGLARHLDQWLATGGIKLAAFVCNGRLIYTRYPAARSFE